MNKFYKNLEKLLKKDSRFLDQEGDLLKNQIIDSAYKADEKLIELLISQKEFKNKFFSKIKDVLVFNINDFVSYISDKNFLSNSYTKYKNKIGLNIDDKFLNQRKEVALVWPFKDCVLEGGMTKEDEKRKEIFFNEILAQDEIDKLFAPKVLTNWKRYTKKGEEKVKEFKRDKDGVIQENLIIKGNNLLALHSLKEQFQGKIKLIYIDPPYNTGNDSFGYNDNFNHSAWLTFMKNRLEMAKRLLRDDGVIFVQCDDNEQAYLKILCDEVFKRENFVANLVWRKKAGGDAGSKHFYVEQEYILSYAKNIKQLPKFIQPLNEKQLKQFINRDNDPRGPWRPVDYSAPTTNKNSNQYYDITSPSGKIFKKHWANTKDKFKKLLSDNRIYFGKDDNSPPRRKLFLSEKLGLTPRTFLYDLVLNIEGSKDLEKLFDKREIFNFPKPVKLIKHIITIVLANNDIILDFFTGSGTTAQAVLELNKEDDGNRKFILIEQLDEHIKICKERIKKVIQKEKIKDNFVYCELMKYNEKFVEKIQEAKDAKALLKIWEEMKEKSFLNYNVDIKKIDEIIEDFKKLSLVEQKHILFALLNKNQLYVNLSEIKDKEFKISEIDKNINKRFYERK